MCKYAFTIEKRFRPWSIAQNLDKTNSFILLRCLKHPALVDGVLLNSWMMPAALMRLQVAQV